jgi:hypothetical protein
MWDHAIDRTFYLLAAILFALAMVWATSFWFE